MVAATAAAEATTTTTTTVVMMIVMVLKGEGGTRVIGLEFVLVVLDRVCVRMRMSWVLCRCLHHRPPRCIMLPGTRTRTRTGSYLRQVDMLCRYVGYPRKENRS